MYNLICVNFKLSFALEKLMKGRIHIYDTNEQLEKNCPVRQKSGSDVILKRWLI